MHFVARFMCAMMLIFFSTCIGYAEKRVALVVGNSAYQYTAALANPVHDADDMALALQEMGFEVIAENNLSKRSLEMAMARFGRAAQDADAVLFYYAGHGIQSRGLNYLMPVDARLEDEFSVNYELVRIEDMLFALSGTRGVKILILDACRNNPLADRLMLRAINRDVVPSRGLARIEAPRGMVIAYATQSNQVAVDGIGRNSPFTKALLTEMERPGLEIATLFRRVAANVDRATGGRQLPELSISMSGEFYLNTRDTDVQAWAKLRGSADQRQLRNFIAVHPDSPLTSDVRERIVALERLEGEQEATRAQAERERFQRERLSREQAEREQLEEERHAREESERRRLEALRPAREQAERDKATTAAQTTNPLPTTHSVLVVPPDEPVPSPAKKSDALIGSTLIQAIKQELKRVGCYAGRIDDNWTSAETKISVAKFSRYANLTGQPDSPNNNFLEFIKGKIARVCPPAADGKPRRANDVSSVHSVQVKGSRVAGTEPNSPGPSVSENGPYGPKRWEPPPGTNCQAFSKFECFWFLRHGH